MNFKLALLTLCQGLLMVNNVTFIAINGLVGLALAPAGWMATLPVTAYVLGSAAAAMPSMLARWKPCSRNWATAAVTMASRLRSVRRRGSSSFAAFITVHSGLVANITP